VKKTQNLREIRESNEEDLKGRVKRLEEELFGLKMKRFTNQLENSARIRLTRREIARTKTILASRIVGSEKQAAATAKPEAQE